MKTYSSYTPKEKFWAYFDEPIQVLVDRGFTFNETTLSIPDIGFVAHIEKKRDANKG